MKLHNFKLIAALASILLSPIALQAMQKGDASPSGTIIPIDESLQQELSQLSNEDFIRNYDYYKPNFGMRNNEPLQYYSNLTQHYYTLLNNVNNRLNKTMYKKEKDQLLKIKNEVNANFKRSIDGLEIAKKHQQEGRDTITIFNIEKILESKE